MPRRVELKCLFRTVSDQLLGLFALDDAEVSMSARKNHETPETEFTQKSETASICMFCFVTVRSKTPSYLRLAEDVHSQVCPARPGRPSTLD